MAHTTYKIPVRRTHNNHERISHFFNKETVKGVPIVHLFLMHVVSNTHPVTFEENQTVIEPLFMFYKDPFNRGGSTFSDFRYSYEEGQCPISFFRDISQFSIKGTKGDYFNDPHGLFKYCGWVDGEWLKEKTGKEIDLSGFGLMPVGVRSTGHADDINWGLIAEEIYSDFDPD